MHRQVDPVSARALSSQSLGAVGAGRGTVLKSERQAHGGENDFQKCAMADAAHALVCGDWVASDWQRRSIGRWHWPRHLPARRGKAISRYAMAWGICNGGCPRGLHRRQCSRRGPRDRCDGWRFPTAGAVRNLKTASPQVLFAQRKTQGINVSDGLIKGAMPGSAFKLLIIAGFTAYSYRIRAKS